MATQSRPASLWTAFAFIIAALVLTSGRTLYDVMEMARTRDDLAMSGVLADAVWCNVLIWVLIGLPLYGAMRGWALCRIGVAGISAALIGLLLVLMRSGNHTLNPWLIAILLLQIAGAALLFTPRANAFFRWQTA